MAAFTIGAGASPALLTGNVRGAATPTAETARTVGLVMV